MQGGAAIKAATRVPEDFTDLGLPRPIEVVSKKKWLNGRVGRVCMPCDVYGRRRPF
jgi:hypothetical protein